MGTRRVTWPFRLCRARCSVHEHYRDSSIAYGDGGPAALRKALALFLSRPELGFVWIAYEANVAVACCVVCHAISTSAGGLVVKLDDVSVMPGREGHGIGSTLIDTLKTKLRSDGIKRIDTSCHLANPRAQGFYLRHGFTLLNEQRLAYVL
jgi:GNAT superfamily N-acetyltransferase